MYTKRNEFYFQKKKKRDREILRIRFTGDAAGQALVWIVQVIARIALRALGLGIYALAARTLAEQAVICQILIKSTVWAEAFTGTQIKKSLIVAAQTVRIKWSVTLSIYLRKISLRKHMFD